MLNVSRGRLGSVVAGLVATSMLAFTGGTAGAVQPVDAGSVRAADATALRPVLANEFGTMKSHVRGEFGKNGVVRGKFTPRRFIQEGGALMAVGKLRATLVRGSGKVVGTDTKRVTLPVMRMQGELQGAQAARMALQAAPCQILHLVLGPLDLNLLGLRIQLNRVVLDITAEPGPGNLLGNLLCAVVGLLDNNGVLTQVRQILNSILGILRL